MAQLSEAVACYHRLLEQDRYQDPDWAEQLQENMRKCSLPESGRLLSPVLRPHFVTRRQLDHLTRVSRQLSIILEQIEALALESRSLLNRLQMLPAENMLAAIPSGYSRSTVAASFNVHLQNGSLSLSGIDACMPAGVAYCEHLSDAFLELPIMREFQLGNCKISKLGGVKCLHSALIEAWKDFGGLQRPNIAVIESTHPASSLSAEAQLLADRFTRLGSPTRVISPESLEYANGRLRSAGFSIDLGFRRLLTRELLVRSGLSNPLLQAYRDHAVCIVNSFRSEMTQRRSMFDLLTDESITGKLSSSDRKLVRSFVPWTRVVAPRKTKYGDHEVDLPNFILRSRERLMLLPNEDRSDQSVFIGREMTASAWERALRLALQSTYVVQECFDSAEEVFPVLAYGELKMKEANVSVHPHVLNGHVNGLSAALHSFAPEAPAPFAVAPVFLLEEN